jgi:hypothetical protein
VTRLVPVLLLAGCPWIGPETHDNNFPDSGANGVREITLTSVDPAFGPTGLLTDVVLTGEGFKPDEANNYMVSVRGLDITDLQVTETTVSFTMPALATPGPVDVVFVEFVDDEDQPLETALTEGFEYFTNRAEFTGLYGIAENFRFINGSWPQRQEDGGSIFVGFLVPTVAISAVEIYAQSPGSCRDSTFLPPLAGTDIDDSAITLRNASGVDVRADRTSPNNSSYSSDIENGAENTVENFDMRSTFDILPIVGGRDLPPFGLLNVFDMPPEVQFNSRSVNIAGGETAQGRFLFSWDHEIDSDDYVVITVDVYNHDWSQYFESVYCIADDAEGQFGIPNNFISNWANGNMMNVKVGRMRTVNNILPHDASGVVFPALNWSGGFIKQVQ